MVSDKSSSDVAVLDPNSLAGMSYDTILANFEGSIDQVVGADLLTKDALVDVPFVITKIVFRPSTFSDPEYVSVEAISREHGDIIFNDGSTGVRDQLIAYCISKGFAVGSVGEAASDLDWIGSANVQVKTTKDAVGPTITVNALLHAKRGLRRSDYEYDNGEKMIPATTYYLG